MTDPIGRHEALAAPAGLAQARAGGTSPSATGAGAPEGAAPSARMRKLRAVAEEFESLMVSTMLRSMRATIPESGLIDDSEALKQYRQLYDDELARAAARSGRGLGIADLIVQHYAGRDAAVAPADQQPSEPGSAWDLFGTPAAVDETDWPVAPGPPVVKASRPDAAGASAPAAWRPAAGRAALAAAPPVAERRAAEKASREPEAATTLAAAAVEAGGDPPPAAAPAWPPLAAAPAEATSAPRALAAYRRAQADDALQARLAQLRSAADAVGGAAADSLQRYGDAIGRATEETGVDPALLLSVLVQESGGDPHARSAKGAVGLMQLMPGTAAEVGVRRPLQPEENILGGARYLARLLARFGQSLELALAGYNAGPGAVERAGGSVPAYRETRGYVGKVLALYERLGGGAGTNLATFGPQP